MSDPEAMSDSEIVSSNKMERERAEFRTLLLSNPNYFGTVEESDFDEVEPIQQNTKYEEIGCVGFDPEFDRLEAVVHVKQPYGYGGDICTNGTPEYVRFYLSFDGGLNSAGSTTHSGTG